MFKTIKLCFIKFALNYFNSRLPEKSSIPRTGKKAEEVNCYSVIITGPATDNKEVLFTGYDKKQQILKVNKQNENKAFTEHSEVSLSHNLNFKIRHFYGLYDLEYSSLCRWFLEGFLKLDWIKIQLYYKFIGSQKFKLLRYKLNFAEGRMTVLQQAIALHLESINRGHFCGNVKFSKFDIANKMYGTKFYGHPHENKFLAQLDMYLDSLCKDEEIISKGVLDYGIGKNAMKTMDNFIRDDRKHKDSIKISRRIVWLTIIIAISALEQAFPGLISNPVKCALEALAQSFQGLKCNLFH